MNKLTKKDYKEIADNMDLTSLFESIEYAIEAYCQLKDKEIPDDDLTNARDEVYEQLTK